MSIVSNNHYPIIETDRFIMRNFCLDDLQDVHDYYSDDEVTKYTQSSKHDDIEVTRNMIHKLMSSYENKKGIAWCIENKTDKKVIGNIGIFGVSPSGHKAEIGFTVSKDYWGKGYGTEMIVNALHFALEKMEINRVEGKCKVDNIGSSKAMEKAGMKLEGTLRDYSIKNGHYYDVNIYSMIRQDLKDIHNNQG